MSASEPSLARSRAYHAYWLGFHSYVFRVGWSIVWLTFFTVDWFSCIVPVSVCVCGASKWCVVFLAAGAMCASRFRLNCFGWFWIFFFFEISQCDNWCVSCGWLSVNVSACVHVECPIKNLRVRVSAHDEINWLVSWWARLYAAEDKDGKLFSDAESVKIGHQSHLFWFLSSISQFWDNESESECTKNTICEKSTIEMDI